MRLLAALLAVALAAAAAAETPLPPPPRDPWAAPPPGGRPAEPPPPRPHEEYPRTFAIGEGQVAPGGFQASTLRADPARSGWRGSVATGVVGKFGGIRITSEHPNPNVLLYFGGEADGYWTEGFRHGARLRLRMFTGGEEHLYLPSDGDVEAAFMLGPQELRFAVVRGELARHPGLGIEALVQAGTLPTLDGTLPLAGDVMRLSYLVAPVEGVWVRYAGGAHLGSAPAPTESNRLSAATAARVRWSALLPPMFVTSLQADLVKFWAHPDLLASVEGSLGVEVLRRTALFDVGVRWNSFTRRGRLPGTSERESEVLLLALASLAL